MADFDSLTLEFSGLHWMEGMPEELDLCAHGSALVRIGAEVLASPKPGDYWTLSAAGLRLLRSLNEDHIPGPGYGEQLIPCCGFSLFPDVVNDRVLILGCPTGIDWEIRHVTGGVRLTTSEGAQVIVSSETWKGAVVRAADLVADFYAQSKPKAPPEEAEEHLGYELFWREWNRLRAAVT